MENEIFKNMFNPPKIKTPYGQRYLINADATASGYFYKPIEKFITKNIKPYYSNTHSNAYSGRLMSSYIEKSKEIIRKNLNLDSEDKIIFEGSGCSGAISHLIHILNLKEETNPKTVVLTTLTEHHSNYLPWTHLPTILKIIDIDNSTGLYNLETLEKYLKEYSNKHKIICSMSHCSNINGIIQNMDKIAKIVHNYGGLLVIDYACSGPYIPINMHKNNLNGEYYDAIFMSPHKFMGGPLCPGLLIANQKLFINTIPFCPGGGTVRFTCPKFTCYTKDIETRETGGTPNIVGSIKCGLVFELKNDLQDFITKRERYLVKKIKPLILKMNNINLLNPPNNNHHLPIFSFMIRDLHYNFVVVLFNDLFGIQTRGGISCCSLYAQHLLKMTNLKNDETYKHIISGNGVPSSYGWCRISFHYYMTDEIIDIY